MILTQCKGTHSLRVISSVTVFGCTIVYLNVVATVFRPPTPDFMHEIKASQAVR